MSLASDCLNYLSSETYAESTRLKLILSDFLYRVVGCTHIEIWSAVYDEYRNDLFTDIFHTSGGAPVGSTFSTVINEEMLRLKLSDILTVDVRLPLTTSVGELDSPRLLIAFKTDRLLAAEDLGAVNNTLNKICLDGFRAGIRRVHETIVDIAQLSKDLTSFFHRSIHMLLVKEFQFEAASIFYYERKTNSLILGATTGITRLDSLGLKRSDIRYFTDSRSYTARAFVLGREIAENVYRGSLHKNTNGESVERISSRIYAPLRRWVGRKDGEDAAECIGILRGVNANMDANHHPVTLMEVARLRVFCSASSVLAERYIKAISILHDQERATHGYNTDLSTIRLAAQNIDRWFARYENNTNRSVKDTLAPQEIRYRVRDILAVQDNMSAQIMTVMHHSGNSRLSASEADAAACDQPYIEVILRLLAAKKACRSAMAEKRSK